jgi:hypothetical protein
MAAAKGHLADGKKLFLNRSGISTIFRAFFVRTTLNKNIYAV